MMISKADFEELFPELFPRSPRNSRPDGLTDTREDTVERNCSLKMRRNRLNARSSDVNRNTDPAHRADKWGMIPALTAMGAAWMMLSGYGYAPRN